MSGIFSIRIKNMESLQGFTYIRFNSDLVFLFCFLKRVVFGNWVCLIQLHSALSYVSRPSHFYCPMRGRWRLTGDLSSKNMRLDLTVSTFLF